MPSRFPQVDLSNLKRVSIADRGGKVSVDDFVRPFEPGPEVDRLLELVPNVLAGADFRTAVDCIVASASTGKTVLAMFGAHVVKCGLSRLIVDLMERGVIGAVATTGAGAIHDFEIAMWGTTSEDVQRNLADGSFGMCRDTADAMNAAVSHGMTSGAGLGESLGQALVDQRAPHLGASILGRAFELGIPATVHVAIGTDIIHQHESADGAALGETSLRDFRVLAGVVGRLEHGTVLNIGSAVVLPEVFLKAVAVARNLGEAARDFAAIGLDMNEPYRAMANVLSRPTGDSGISVHLKGRHEFVLPILWMALARAVSAS